MAGNISGNVIATSTTPGYYHDRQREFINGLMRINEKRQIRKQQEEQQKRREIAATMQLLAENPEIATDPVFQAWAEEHETYQPGLQAAVEAYANQGKVAQAHQAAYNKAMRLREQAYKDRGELVEEVKAVPDEVPVFAPGMPGMPTPMQVGSMPNPAKAELMQRTQALPPPEVDLAWGMSEREMRMANSAAVQAGQTPFFPMPRFGEMDPELETYWALEGGASPGVESALKTMLGEQAAPGSLQEIQARLDAERAELRQRAQMANEAFRQQTQLIGQEKEADLAVEASRRQTKATDSPADIANARANVARSRAGLAAVKGGPGKSGRAASEVKISSATKKIVKSEYTSLPEEAKRSLKKSGVSSSSDFATIAEAEIAKAMMAGATEDEARETFLEFIKGRGQQMTMPESPRFGSAPVQPYGSVPSGVGGQKP